MYIQAILVVLYCLVCKIQYVELAIMCNQCGPGTFVLTHCNKTIQTVCEPCKDATFSTHWTSREECLRCSNGHCQPTMGLVQICNGTVDNQCGCVKPDQFHHISTDSCRDCMRCPPGKYPIKPCTGETICAPCPKNYFSNKTDNYHAMCIKCTRCKIYETMCTSTQDAVCRKNVFTTEVFTTPQRQAFMDGTPTLKTEKWNPTDSHFKKTTYKVDPIIIVVVVCVIIVMIIVATLVYWRKKKQIYSRRRGFSIIQESRARVFSFGGLLLREQPAEMMLGLHTLLNPEAPNNWRAVAAEIGVPYGQIQNFATNIETATKEMLHYWGTSNAATLDILYEALRTLGRDDACTFMQTNVELESVETTV